MSTYITINQTAAEVEIVEEEDAHLPRVRVELDRLNYANESINNLEVELEEAKREFIQTMRDSEFELSKLEKKIGTHVMKVLPYYEEKWKMNLSKQKYLAAKFEFETAQELYVVAKNLQMYAEENLEGGGGECGTGDGDLGRMLKMARDKVSERELTKQSSDLEQIEAFKVYDEQATKIAQTEKKLKTSIVKSLKYFQIKAGFNKELKFFLVKTEGLKSCLKEAKTTYQQSLTNLEKISTEVHEQRNNNRTDSNTSLKSEKNETLSPNLNSVSSPNLSAMEKNTTDLDSKLKSTSLVGLCELKSTEDEVVEEEKDYDTYFVEQNLKNELDKGLGFAKTVHYTQKMDVNAVCLLSDDEIEYLSLDRKLKKFAGDLGVKPRVTEKIVVAKPKITVPVLSRTKYM